MDREGSQAVAAAKSEFHGETIQKELAAREYLSGPRILQIIAEEAPGVYKPSEDVVDVVHQLGIARKVVKLMPLGVAKG